MNDLENQTPETSIPPERVDVNGVVDSLIKIVEGSRKGIFKTGIDRIKLAQALNHIPTIVLKSAIPELKTRLDKEMKMSSAIIPIGGGMSPIGSNEICVIRSILDAIKERLSGEEN